MEKLFKIIPEAYFATNLKENRLGNIKIAVLREATGNLIIRSNYADETITFKIDDKRDVVEIPARKIKSREKLMGLKICREQKVVESEVRYNVIKDKRHLANPNSILFGDSVTQENNSASLTSRVSYDWAYSLRDVGDITAIMQHNALSEGGTMWDEEEGKHRESLFQVQYVKPGTLFPHFLSVENVTPELFIHLLFCVLFENRYFAQSTTSSGSNVKNHIIGVGFGKFEQPLNSYTISKDWKTDTAVTDENVSKIMADAMKASYGDANFKEGKLLVDLVSEVWEDEKSLDSMYKKCQEECEQFLKDIKVYPTAKAGKNKTGKSDDNPTN